MIRLLLLLLLLPSLADAQEAWLDDDKPADTILVDPLSAKVDALAEQVSALSASLSAMKFPEPSTCNCQCPTIDEIRSVVREEIDRVTITVKTVAGVEKKVEMPVSQPAAAKVMELQPGERVVAINGVPVQPFNYRSEAYNAPITRYQTHAYEMRVLNQGGRFFGAVRSSQTCRMVNGVQVCN